jgi:hypothetical protein
MNYTRNVMLTDEGYVYQIIADGKLISTAAPFKTEVEAIVASYENMQQLLIMDLNATQLQIASMEQFRSNMESQLAPLAMALAGLIQSAVISVAGAAVDARLTELLDIKVTDLAATQLPEMVSQKVDSVVSEKVDAAVAIKTEEIRTAMTAVPIEEKLIEEPIKDIIK